MFDCFISQVLVVFLLFFCCVRIFFTKNSRIDSIVILTPLALVLSILNLFVFNLNKFSALIFVLAFIIFLTNFRSLFRLSARLFVDHYAPAFVIFSFIEILVLLTTLFMLIQNRPVKVEPEKFNTQKKVFRLAGNFASGFHIIKDFSFNERCTAFFYSYTPALGDKENLPLIVLAGTEKAEITQYEPYILFLTKAGFTVVAGDFYARDTNFYDGILNSRFLRKFYSDLGNASNSERNTIRIRTYKSLVNLSESVYGNERAFYFVTDSLDFDSVYEIMEYAGQKSLGFFPLNKISEYKSPELGFIEQTDIFVAKKIGLLRDKSFFIPRYAANKTLAELKILVPEEVPLEVEQKTENVDSSSADLPSQDLLESSRNLNSD